MKPISGQKMLCLWLALAGLFSGFVGSACGVLAENQTVPMAYPVQTDSSKPLVHSPDKPKAHKPAKPTADRPKLRGVKQAEPVVEEVSQEKKEALPQALSINERLAQTMTQSFREDFTKVLKLSIGYLEKTASKKRDRQKTAVVLDLDETLLDNRVYFLVNGEYDPVKWDEWVSYKEAPAIYETREYVRWLNKMEYQVYFVSGRREHQREQTVNNLRRIGVTNYAGLYLKPDDYTQDSAQDFKVVARKDIEKHGHRVLVIIGDQKSDLEGGYGKGFKLPNPLYQIP